ncbi:MULTISPECIES: OmpA family protein [unclassified Legionella]|uniref:OmpA family protein n=1 Tax=unclassified Legionella TaxID=2622702 RepID=UPI001055AF89|nr:MULTISPECIES: OmpA family protein [unclassified Legionella]MDI9817641.1 OmpA family protein [Legionella sp. PL877]
MRGRKNKNDSHEDTHRWVVSYADFITLLFAFFVVMYAISSVNVSKYKSLAQGMHTAFARKDDKKPVAEISSLKTPNSPAASQQSKDPFNELVQALANLQDADYRMYPQDGWVELDMKAGGLFDSGSAELRPVALVKLMKIADVLKQQPYPIALEGYTDNIPIYTSQYPSNWELSSARAAAVARILTAFGVEQTRITVTGFGEQYPVAENDTKEGRAKNRRVNLIIAKDKSIPRLLNPALMIKNENLIPDNKQAEEEYSVRPPEIDTMDTVNSSSKDIQ